jgi:hypothetical protein
MDATIYMHRGKAYCYYLANDIKAGHLQNSGLCNYHFSLHIF